ncbi:MAG: flavodoxin [Tetragenococcus sp.]|nr:flavodoxin [Tetragenococcus sp.]
MALAKIVYASITGNTEEISEFLEEYFANLDIDVERVEADDAVADFFADADLCVVATYTDDEGALPMELEDFYDDLPEQDLTGKVYGVVGSGDNELYPEFFCDAAVNFDQAFTETGATQGHEVVKIENEAEDEDKVRLEEFVKTLASL